MSMTNRNFYFPKYNFGLLETPESSDVNSLSDTTGTGTLLLSSSINTDVHKTPSSGTNSTYRYISYFK